MAAVLAGAIAVALGPAPGQAQGQDHGYWSHGAPAAVQGIASDHVASAEFLSPAEPGPVEDATNSLPSFLPGATSGSSSEFTQAGANAADADDPWTWQLLPTGVIYHSYLAGMREPRMAVMWVHEQSRGWMLDGALGGRIGLLRCGTGDALWPEGWQLDFEGAAFPRIDVEHELDVLATDFRYGVPITWGMGGFRTKLAFYHISSHLGDEFMLRYPDYPRINYVRDGLAWGVSYYLAGDVRLYAEAGWAYHKDGGAKPWELQFGVDYSPAEPVLSPRGAPFVAINAHLREELDFGGNVVVQTGWQWRGGSGQLVRLGMQYFSGKSEQFEFYRQTEDKLGLGLWYDF